jgi:hypothetical protein
VWGVRERKGYVYKRIPREATLYRKIATLVSAGLEAGLGGESERSRTRSLGLSTVLKCVLTSERSI